MRPAWLSFSCRRVFDHSNEGFKGWEFMTVHCWGERAAGEWTLEIQDTPSQVRSPTTQGKRPHSCLPQALCPKFHLPQTFRSQIFCLNSPKFPKEITPKNGCKSQALLHRGWAEPAAGFLPLANLLQPRARFPKLNRNESKMRKPESCNCCLFVLLCCLNIWSVGWLCNGARGQCPVGADGRPD